MHSNGLNKLKDRFNQDEFKHLIKRCSKLEERSNKRLEVIKEYKKNFQDVKNDSKELKQLHVDWNNRRKDFLNLDEDCNKFTSNLEGLGALIKEYEYNKESLKAEAKSREEVAYNKLEWDEESRTAFSIEEFENLLKNKSINKEQANKIKDKITKKKEEQEKFLKCNRSVQAQDILVKQGVLTNNNLRAKMQERINEFISDINAVNTYEEIEKKCSELKSICEKATDKLKDIEEKLNGFKSHYSKLQQKIESQLDLLQQQNPTVHKDDEVIKQEIVEKIQKRKERENNEEKKIKKFCDKE
ncbi:hypothetical protein [Wolbachia endosymbiont of Pentidionis agamae]|uniref:hypothetical protein n=1 Tax=Wolbachia endosymbiont of Pentidionis agamae TaxID=3110435 RepID=UPI002FD04B4E